MRNILAPNLKLVKSLFGFILITSLALSSILITFSFHKTKLSISFKTQKEIA